MLVLMLALLLTGSAWAQTPRKFFWPEEKAEAMASAKVRVPYCALFGENDPACAEGWYRPDGRPRVGFYELTEVTCRGADERGETFTFARFTCRFYAGVSARDYGRGSLRLWTTGRTTFRWRLVTIQRI